MDPRAPAWPPPPHPPSGTGSTPHIDPVWQRAAVLGSLWAASEIVLGSFLHNVRLPFAGHILTFLAVAILVSGHRMWRTPGLVARAGLIAALMKSLSPSAVLIGPMVAIAMEGLLMEVAIRVAGGRAAGYVLGGALAMSWTLAQKIVSLLLTYGPDTLRLYGDAVALAERQLGPIPFGAWGPLLALTVLNLGVGAAAALVGMRLSPGSADAAAPGGAQLPAEWLRRLGGPVSAGARPVLGWLAFWVVALPAGLVLISRLTLGGKALFACAALALAAARYGPALRRLARPGFWAGLVLVTMAAGALAGALSPQAPRGWITGVGVGLGMSLHAVFVTVSFTALSVELTHPSLRVWLERVGGGQLHRALQGAFATLPLIVAALPAPHVLAGRPLRTLGQLLAHVDGWLAALNRPVRFLGIVTGSQGAGKTTALTRAVEALRAQGVGVAGVLAPGTVQDGTRWTVDLLRLDDGTRSPLATRDPASPWPRRGGFHVSPAAVAAGLSALTALPPGTEVVVVDEIGPWELSGAGWGQALEALRVSGTPVVAAVRPTLLREVVARYAPGEDPDVWDASRMSPEAVAEAVVAAWVRNARGGPPGVRPS